MRLASLTWASDVALLLQAARETEIELQAWAVSELNDENVEDCISSLNGSEAILLHPCQQDRLFDQVVEKIDKKIPIISFGLDPALWSFSYYGDTRDRENAEIRALADEMRRVVRTRLLNPKWIEGMKQHGYKGAGDISKRVGRVYGWEATTEEVDDWIFDDIAKTFIPSRGACGRLTRRFWMLLNPAKQ